MTLQDAPTLEALVVVDGTPAPTPRVRRRPRRTRPRARSVTQKRITRKSLVLGALMYSPDEYTGPRPITRKDCLPGGCNEQRPCPFVTCKHHLFLDVNPETGSIKFNFPDLEPWELAETCTLDLADRPRGHDRTDVEADSTLEQVGEAMNITRERVRQIERNALLKLKAAGGEVLAAEMVALLAQRNEEAAEPLAAAPPITTKETPMPRGVPANGITCSICGEKGHTSRSPKHKGGGAKPSRKKAPKITPPPSLESSDARERLAALIDDFRTQVLDAFDDEVLTARVKAKGDLLAKLEADDD